MFYPKNGCFSYIFLAKIFNCLSFHCSCQQFFFDGPTVWSAYCHGMEISFKLSYLEGWWGFKYLRKMHFCEARHWPLKIVKNLVFRFKHLKMRKVFHPQKTLESMQYKLFKKMHNTYRFGTKLWLPCSGEAGKTLKKVIANKNRQCQQNQKVPLIFFQSSPYSDSL